MIDFEIDIIFEFYTEESVLAVLGHLQLPLLLWATWGDSTLWREPMAEQVAYLMEVNKQMRLGK